MDAMMLMLLELRASLEWKLKRGVVPSADRAEVALGCADVEAMILQAGGEPSGRIH